jgi:DNA-binding SARP family transcriptional activator
VVSAPLDEHYLPGNEIVDAPKSLRRHQLRILGAVDLRNANGDEVASILAQPKRLGLLCYLALAHARFTRRDTLLALFWPELSDEQARNNLRQSVHYLRRELGSDVLEVRGDGSLAVDPERLWCDAAAFLELSQSGRYAEALDLVRGELLPGLFVPGASPELEQWFDAQRVRLRGLAADTAMAHAEEREAAGHAVDAVRWGRWAFERVPQSEAILRRLIALLDRRGDRFGALLAYDQFARLLADEFEATPSPETVALIDAVRRGATQGDSTAVAAADSTPEAT